MLPKSLFLSLFFILISSPLCFTSFLQDDEHLAKVVDQTPETNYDLSSYPSFFGSIHDDDQSYDIDASFAKLKMGYRDDIVDSTGYHRPGTPATGQGEVNVDDFGAEGDGETDDTEVP